MKIVINLDNYQLEHCKRHVEERYSNMIEEAVVKGDLLDDVLDSIKAKIDKESVKAFGLQNWERAKALECALGIIDKYKESDEV